MIGDPFYCIFHFINLHCYLCRTLLPHDYIFSSMRMRCKKYCVVVLLPVSHSNSFWSTFSPNKFNLIPNSEFNSNLTIVSLLYQCNSVRHSNSETQVS